MTERVDPLDNIEFPTLAKQIEPYRKYGDSELAVTLLGFQKAYQIGLPSLTTGDVPTFAARCRPADAGATFVCGNCDEAVRAVTIPGRGPCICPLCSERAGILELGRGVPDDYYE